ncbi:MAG: SDR family oxidoreductase [Pseudomonadales bacterium]
MDIQGKVAVITGGASGLGAATARLLVSKGARVSIFDLQEDKGTALVQELGADKALFTQVNVTSEESVQAGVAATMAKFGSIHVCCNFAGIGNAIKTVGKDGPFPLDKFKLIIDVNLIGSFNVLRLCANEMQKNEPFNEYGGRGCIINTASVAAYEGQIGQAAYSASKGGIVGMTLPIARDLSSIGVRCNTIVPGLIHTPLFQGAPQNVIDALSAQVLYPKRLGRPEEIAHVAIMLIENEYMNGECVRMDGGIRMQPR